MEQATELELFRRQLEHLLSIFTHDILPNVVGWLLISCLFIALGVLVIRGRASSRSATVQIFVLGILCTAIIAFLDFWRSFGEAFTHGIDRYRAPIHYSLTAAAIIIGIYYARRRR
jgi:hypothetical protein